jgi:Domain of unknown function (DUF397)
LDPLYPSLPRGFRSIVCEARVSEPKFVVSSRYHTGSVGVTALPDGGVAVRDTKTADGPVLTFTADEWDAFLRGVAAGEFDPAVLSR